LRGDLKMVNHHFRRKKERRRIAQKRQIENLRISQKVLNSLLSIQDVRYTVINLRGEF